MGLIKCWFCEEAIEDTLTDCPHCNMPVITFPGIKQEPPKAIKQEPQKEEKKPELCKKCGRPMPEDAAFCPRCGVSAKAEVEQVASEGKEIVVPLKSATKNTNNRTQQNIHAYAQNKHKAQKRKGTWKKAVAIIATLSVCIFFIWCIKTAFDPGYKKYAYSSSASQKSTSSKPKTNTSSSSTSSASSSYSTNQSTISPPSQPALAETKPATLSYWEKDEATLMGEIKATVANQNVFSSFTISFETYPQDEGSNIYIPVANGVLTGIGMSYMDDEEMGKKNLALISVNPLPEEENIAFALCAAAMIIHSDTNGSNKDITSAIQLLDSMLDSALANGGSTSTTVGETKYTIIFSPATTLFKATPA